MSSSCRSVDAIDSESVDEQPRSFSPDLQEQITKHEPASEHTAEPEQLLTAPIPTKGYKKKKKGKPANKPHVEPSFESPVEPEAFSQI